MKRVYLNRFFSTAYFLIDLLKKSGFYVIASSNNPNAVYKTIADEFFIETGDFSENCCCDKDLISYYKNVIIKKKADIFFPYFGLEQISKFKHEIEHETGVKIIVDDYEKIKCLFSKIETYKLIENSFKEIIPPYYAVNSSDDFLYACHEIQKITPKQRICFKYDKGAGGAGFRIIDDDFFEQKSFPPPLSGMKITSKDIMKYYDGKKIILMPFLEEPEISVDCFRTSEKNIIIPRVKLDGRIEKFEYRNEVIKFSESLLELFKPEHPFNIQFRYFKNELKLLEINPRLSGNAHMSCQAAKVNIPAAAAHKTLGENYSVSPEYKEKLFSFVEMPVEIYGNIP